MGFLWLSREENSRTIRGNYKLHGIRCFSSYGQWQKNLHCAPRLLRWRHLLPWTLSLPARVQN